MRRAGIIFGITLSFFGTSTQASPPIASHVCEASALAVFHHTMGDDAREQTRQAVHRMKMFRSTRLQELEPQANIVTGYSGEDGGWRALSQSAVAGRLHGLEKFAATEESDQIDERHVTRGVVIEGRAAIEDFLRQSEDAVTTFEQYNQEILKSFKGALIMFGIVGLFTDKEMLLQTILNPGRANPVAVFAVGAGLFWAHGLKIDYIYRRPFFWDYSWRANNARLRENLDLIADKPRSWHFDAQNFKLYDLVLNHLEALRDPLAKIINHQTYSEAKPYIQFPLEASRMRNNPAMKAQWVGIDRLLDTNEKGEPRLSVVVRYSRQRPLYPKTSPAIERGWNLAPAAITQP